ncbi:MAG: ABC transporter substrate-binding protein [Oceanospirillaceae bacterium]|uniref:substrate-binding periplasmic protein n=1 Tax=unclassified Thalassolituus TaxID=2624967 RepID=UPI000C379593|nr:MULTISPECIES: transporter substrate-binding domain-containing protein [unclassified Thalassolituus]MBL36283.1 ABC transporter substrate-binding protein [Oceanospirillaceae bacterium]MBS53970.1 ABC transporter substrate-binding protein [Oceanospirillaceae bacterium]|tara:strand:- start:2473 stop:3198 length:726 start_codon:yes stop_codon:yes gene_type:complete
MRWWALLTFLFSVQLFAETLDVAAEDAWPPFSDASGNGYSRQLAEAAFKLSGITLNVQTVPYARALNMTKGGSVDACWNVTRQPSTEVDYIFGSVPLFQAAASYFYKRGQARDFHRPEDIPDGTRVAVINGYEYGQEFEHNKKRFKLIEVSKQTQMLALLLNDRVDVAIMFDHVYDYIMSSQFLDKSAYEKGYTNHISDIYIAFSRQNESSSRYAKLLDEGLLKLKESGEYDRIMNSAPVI